MQADIAIQEIARFIDLTVRRLDDKGITGSLLQEEWRAIQDSHAEERDFCLLAAAWGHDPYDTPSDVESTPLNAGAVIDEIVLLSDLARVVPLNELDSATDWLRTSRASLAYKTLRTSGTGASGLVVGCRPTRLASGLRHGTATATALGILRTRVGTSG